MAKLIGTKTVVTNKEVFRLNMFDFDTEEDTPGAIEEAAGGSKEEDTTVNISLNSSKTRQDLEKIISEMTVTQDNGDEDDLLSLMDKAS